MREGGLIGRSPRSDLTLRSDGASLLSHPYSSTLWKEESKFGGTGERREKWLMESYKGKFLCVCHPIHRKYTTPGTVG